MSEISLLDFDSQDKLKNYVFESEYIRFLDNDGEIFKVKTKLRIARVPKKKSLEYVVVEESIYPNDNPKLEELEPDELPPQIVENDIDGFKTQEKAVEFFVNKVEELKFFQEKDKENILFDTIRYFWKVDDKGKVIERSL